MATILLIGLLLIPALYLTKGTYRFMENKAKNTSSLRLWPFSVVHLHDVIHFLGESPTLARIVDVHHLDFDCCAYLLFYTVLNEACWHVIMGISYVFLIHVQPLDPGLDWGTCFILGSMYYSWRIAGGVAMMFDTLGCMLSSDPRLPFHPVLSTILINLVALPSFALGNMLALTLGMEVGADALRQLVLGLAAAYPRTSNWAPVVGLLFAVFLLSLFMLQLTPLLINGTPLSWFSYRVTNYLARQIRGRVAARRLDVSSAFLRFGEDQIAVFQYGRLPHLSFRLLKLDASRGRSGHVVCSMEVHMRNSSTEYEAISYCWGDDRKTHSLMVRVDSAQMRHIKITKSVHDVLATLCPTEGERYLWIDAICLNQDDLDEKDTQIPLMKEVFSEASRVIAYLGTSKHASLANDFITRAIWHGIGVGIPSVEVDGKYDIDVPFKFDTDGWRAFRALVINPFWSRAWILQEVVLAKKLFIYNGNSIFPWPFLYNFEKMFKGYNMRAPYFKERGSVPDRPLFIEADVVQSHSLMLEYRRGGKRDNQEPLKPNDLADLLVTLRKLKVTHLHPEDKINSVLAISTAHHSLRPNHRNSVEEVYTSATIHTLMSGSFLIFSIAGLCYRRKDRREEPPLPSWVPDLFESPWMINDVGYVKYGAGTSASLSHEMRHNGRELKLFGYIIDEVQCCGSPGIDPANYPFSLTAEDVKARKNEFYTIHSPRSAPGHVFRSLLEMMEILKADSYLNDLDTIVALTAVEDFDGETFPASDDIIQSYRDFIKLMSILVAEAALKPRTVVGRFRKSRKADHAKANLMWWKFFKRAETVFIKRKVALTCHGYAAMVPKGTAKGDVLCVFEGSPVPHVLRPARNGCYYLYGDAYLHGFMSGEALWRKGNWITLI